MKTKRPKKPKGYWVEMLKDPRCHPSVDPCRMSARYALGWNLDKVLSTPRRAMCWPYPVPCAVMARCEISVVSKVLLQDRVVNREWNLYKALTTRPHAQSSKNGSVRCRKQPTGRMKKPKGEVVDVLTMRWA